MWQKSRENQGSWTGRHNFSIITKREAVLYIEMRSGGELRFLACDTVTVQLRRVIKFLSLGFLICKMQIRTLYY